MRDVKRCTKLERWFLDNLAPRQTTSTSKSLKSMDLASQLTGRERKQAKKRERKKKKEMSQTSEAHGKSKKELQEKANTLVSPLCSIVLALAVSYHTRLGTSQLRQDYRSIFK